MDQTVLSRIEQALPGMTKKQQLIATAILDEPLSFAFTTVHAFAIQTGVSPASVVRFCQQFSPEGFPGLQAELQKHIQEVSDPIKRMELSFIPDSDDEMLATKIFETQIQNLQSTFTRTFISSALQSVDLISRADHIFTLGSRGSRAVAYYLGHHLNRVFLNVDIVPDDDRLADHILRAKKSDVAIIFALPRYSSRLLAVAKQMHATGMRIITVNDTLRSPFVDISDIAFTVAYRSSDFHNSQLSSMLLAEMLISLVINKDRDTAMKNLDLMESRFSDLGQFVK